MKNRVGVASVLTMALCGVLIAKSLPSTVVVSVQEEATQEVNQPDLGVPTGRVFGSEAGVIFNPIKKDKTDDFEIVIGRIQSALKVSPDPIRRQQGDGWKAYRAVEPGPNGSVLYLFFMDPVVVGADYTVSQILSEAFPDKIQEIYKLYIGAYAGNQSLLNLDLVKGKTLPLEQVSPK